MTYSDFFLYPKLASVQVDLEKTCRSVTILLFKVK